MAKFLMANVQEFLSKSACDKFSWRDNHCALWVADWIKNVTGIDAARSWRHEAPGRAIAVSRSRSEMIGIIRSLADDAGLALTDTPSDGDVAIAEVDGGLSLCIRFDGRWAFKSPNGVTILRKADILMAWRILEPDNGF
jgi:hypothetical protein